MELIGHARPAGRLLRSRTTLGDLLLGNSDIAFRGNHAVPGQLQRLPDLGHLEPGERRSCAPSFVCPGGQGDLSVHGNLLFMSVEMPNGRVDCGTQGVAATRSSADRFRGVRIFDISNLAQPRQVAAVQTCRGSHTHTLVTDPKDTRERLHLRRRARAACARRPSSRAARPRAGRGSEHSAYFRIEVIQVPLAAPQNARIVSTPRIFADRDGQHRRPLGGRPHGAGTQTTSQHEPVPRHHRVSRRSASPPAHARATASCSTSATPRTRAASTR